MRVTCAVLAGHFAPSVWAPTKTFGMVYKKIPIYLFKRKNRDISINRFVEVLHLQGRIAVKIFTIYQKLFPFDVWKYGGLVSTETQQKHKHILTHLIKNPCSDALTVY